MLICQNYEIEQLRRKVGGEFLSIKHNIPDFKIYSLCNIKEGKHISSFQDITKLLMVSNGGKKGILKNYGSLQPRSMQMGASSTVTVKAKRSALLAG